MTRYILYIAGTYEQASAWGGTVAPTEYRSRWIVGVQCEPHTIRSYDGFLNNALDRDNSFTGRLVWWNRTEVAA